MKIKYDGSFRFTSIKEVLHNVFSINFFEGEKTPKSFNIILLGREWTWDLGEWK